VSLQLLPAVLAMQASLLHAPQLQQACPCCNVNKPAAVIMHVFSDCCCLPGLLICLVTN
jgi:hypothetical protein